MSDAAAEVRIAIADDHQIFRDGLRRLLESEAGFRVVAEASDGDTTVRVTREHRPDVLLLDIAMPRLSGLEVLAAIADERTRAVVLTASIEPADLIRAIQLGARGVVLKESATRQLIDGIRRVMDDKYVIGGDVSDSLMHAVKQAGAHSRSRYRLTARELDVLGAVVRGASNRDIAVQLSISLQTVKHHLTSIFDKTGTSSRLELALFAIRQDLVDSD